MNALNNFVRNGMSEQVKAERRAAGLRDPKATAPQQGMQAAMRGVTPLDKLLEVEDLLVKLIIHHGEKHIVVKDVEGNDIELPIAQYIYLDMSGDEFRFHNDLYNRILQETLEHLEDENFGGRKTYLPTIRIRGEQDCQSADGRTGGFYGESAAAAER